VSQAPLFVFVRVAYETTWHRSWVGRALLPFDMDKVSIAEMDQIIDVMVATDLRTRGIVIPDIAVVRLEFICETADEELLSLATDGVAEVTPGLRMFWHEVKPELQISEQH
jgi:hypothetical protein